MKANVCAVMCCVCVVACDSEGGAKLSTAERDSGVEEHDADVVGSGLNVLSPSESYAGKSLEEWAVEYARWSSSQTSCESALHDGDGSKCAMYQEDSDSPVFFFARSEHTKTAPPVISRTLCRVPAGKAILVPIALVNLDNNILPKPRPDDALRALLADTKETMRNMILKADGQDVSDLVGLGIGPLEYEYYLPPEPNIFSCGESEVLGDKVVRPSYVTGYGALIEPPSAGRHELEYASAFTFLHGEYAYHVKASFVVEDDAE